MTFENIQRLLFLEMQIKKLDYTGLTNINDSTEELIKRYEEHHKTYNFTPIENIMNIILMSVDRMLGDFYCVSDRPFIWVVPQKKIDEFRVDFEVTFIDKGINKKYIIECDGHEFHEKTKEQAAYDKKRERFLVKDGYKVLRYTGSEIYKDFEMIKQELYDIFSEDVEDSDI